MKSAMKLVAMSVAALMVAAVVFAKTGKEAPDSVTIDGCKTKKPAVVMAHKKHVDAKIECTKCHHDNKDLKAGAAVEVKSCASCHKTPEKPETLKCTEISPSKNNFHKLCITCHKEDKAKKAPTECKGCHKE